MVRKIYLNDSKVEVTGDDELPGLVHGKDGVGASLFTVTWAANLVRAGKKLIFVSGYPMARDELMKQVDEPSAVMMMEKMGENINLNQVKVVFGLRGNADLVTKLAHTLSAWKEGVVIIKNIDLFEAEIFNMVKTRQKLLLSGDVDKCSFADRLAEVKFVSRLGFSKPKRSIGVEIPSLEKYCGYGNFGKLRGVVRVV